ncbi:MAG TPA: peroxiredoxin, partial [Planctomycetota bacterium]|nr:peroxiredoxin [Planctomycetota bacterium]
PVTLSSLWAKGPLLLVFYPGDETPVCTAQLCEYRDRWADFAAAGVQVVGINPASHERHQKFSGHHHFQFPLLSDPDSACCKAYGAKAWYGTRRQVVLIDQRGQERWRDVTFPFFRPKADALLAAVRQHLG